MDTLFNITAIKNRMDDIPKGQRINNFFDGAIDQLSNDQKKDILTIINLHHERIVEFIEQSIDNNETIEDND